MGGERWLACIERHRRWRGHSRGVENSGRYGPTCAISASDNSRRTIGMSIKHTQNRARERNYSSLFGQVIIGILIKFSYKWLFYRFNTADNFSLAVLPDIVRAVGESDWRAAGAVSVLHSSVVYVVCRVIADSSMADCTAQTKRYQWKSPNSI